MEATDQDLSRRKQLRNRWKTDENGQRNIRTPGDQEPFNVIVGDSNVDGSSLSQQDILAEELGRKTKTLWINLTHEYMDPWEHPLCRKKLPEAIVLQLKRGTIQILPELGGRSKDPKSSRWIWLLQKVDHASKLCLINKSRAHLNNSPLVVKQQLQDPHLSIPLGWLEEILAGGYLYRSSDPEAWGNLSPEQIIGRYADFCRERGIFFLLVVLPDQNRSADEMVLRLVQRGIATVGFFPSREWPDGTDLKTFWQSHDSHWTTRGVKITASEIVKTLPRHE